MYVCMYLYIIYVYIIYIYMYISYIYMYISYIYICIYIIYIYVYIILLWLSFLSVNSIHIFVSSPVFVTLDPARGHIWAAHHAAPGHLVRRQPRLDVDSTWDRPTVPWELRCEEMLVCWFFKSPGILDL